MALTDIFVSHDTGSDFVGDGSKTSPYQTLGWALSNVPAVSTGHAVRVNVRGTSAASPMTSLGSMPSGRTISTQVIVCPYDTDAQDTTDKLFIDSGSGAAWSQPSDEGFAFVRCSFTRDNPGMAFDFDNQVALYECDFTDGCYPENDSALIAWFCTFTDQEGDVFKSSGNSGLYYCLIEGSGDYDGVPVNVANMVGSIIYWDGSCNHLARFLTASANCLNNSFLYESNSHTGTADGYGIRTDDQMLAAFNYISNAALGIDTESNAEGFPQGPNCFWNCTTNRFTLGSGRVDYALPMEAADYELTADGIPNADSGDYTPTTELAELRTNQYSPFPGTSTTFDAHFGSPFIKIAASDGLAYTPRLRKL